MNKAYFLLLPILFVVGFFAFQNRTALLNNPISNILGSAVGTVKSTWDGLPIWVKGLIPLGIPIATTVFFAWASSLWRKKAQQTEIIATQQQTQLQGELTEAQAVNTNLQGTIKTLSSQPTNASALELKEALFNIQTKDQRIKSLEEKIHDLQILVSDQKLDIKMYQQRIKELTTVA